MAELNLGRFQILTDLATDWTASNPTLMRGELGVADPDGSAPVLKVGDGARAWSSLPAIVGGSGGGAGPDYVVGSTTTLAPGSFATVTINNVPDPPTISFGIPRGDVGPANALAIGTVTTGAPGSAAGATIFGTPPSQTLNLTIPAGANGANGTPGADGMTGPPGATGPANSLDIGTVTTGAAGSAAAASITGTPPSQTLNLTIPTGAAGPVGPEGPMGPSGPAGSTTLADPTGVIGLTAVNGVSAFAIRSDGSPPLSQAIVPTWTGAHTFTSSTVMGAPTGGAMGAGTLNAVGLYIDGVAVAAGAHVLGANPSASVGLAAVNGVATTYMRSDAAPALSVAIVPTWTGAHTFNVQTKHKGGIVLEATTPQLKFDETDAPTDERIYDVVQVAGQLIFRARTDADGAGTNWLAVDRTAASVTSITLTSTVLAVLAVGLFGTSASLSVGNTSGIQQWGTAVQGASHSITRGGNDANGGRLGFGKTRSTTYDGLTPVISGDVLGQVAWFGADGTNLNTAAAQVVGYASGAVSTGVVPGEIRISTASDVGAMTERFRVSNFGGLGVAGSNYGLDGQVLASQGPTLAPVWRNAGSGSIDMPFKFNTSVGGLDPGAQSFNQNSATYSAVTLLGFDTLSTTNFDAATILSLLVAGNRIYLQQVDDSTHAVIYEVTGPATDMTGWWRVPVSFIRTTAGGALFTANKPVTAVFIMSSSSVTVASPTGTIGLTAVNGSATTAMRSDAAPPLSQAISPTWTGAHLFTGAALNHTASGVGIGVDVSPKLTFGLASSAANEKIWDLNAGASFSIRAVNDAATDARAAFGVARSGYAISAVAFGNASDSPTYTFFGSGLTTFGGNVTMSGALACNPGPITCGLSAGQSGHMAVQITATEGLYLVANNSGSVGGGGMPANSYGLATAAGSNISFALAGTIRAQVTPTGLYVSGNVRTDGGLVNTAGTLQFLPNTGALTYGSHYVTGAVGTYHGIAVYDGTLNPTLMSSGVASGIYLQGEAKWLLFRSDASNAITQYALNAVAFYTASASGGSMGAGTINATAYYVNGVALATGGSGANPSASVGLTAVNGSAGTFMRSDAAPPLSVSISPTWTGTHLFTGATANHATSAVGLGLESGFPAITFGYAGAATDAKSWDMLAQAGPSGNLTIRAINDAATVARNCIEFTRSGLAVVSITFGNATDNTGFTFTGTGGVWMGGYLQVQGAMASPSSLVMGAPTGLAMGAGTINAQAVYVNGVAAVTSASIPSGANPSAQVGLTALNGSAGTWMRSDAAPALNQSISPTWSGSHTFSNVVTATGFTVSSSRAVKRETGAPRYAADILARLRPILYRLLAGSDSEQLGLIAEEVHDVCPLLSDGRTVAYDRLAILLLADWQDRHAVAA